MSSKSSGILRITKTKDYFVAANEPFNDRDLSFAARGVMGYLLSKPDGWTVRNSDLYKQSKDSEHAVKKALAELKKFGYVRRYRANNAKGHVEWVTEVYEVKALNPDYAPTDEAASIGDATDGRISPIGDATDGCIADDRSDTRIVNTETKVNTEKDKEQGDKSPPAEKPVAKKSSKKQKPKTPKPEPSLALQVFREKFHLNPTKLQAPQIDAVVTDVEIWSAVCDAWVMQGYRPHNVKGLLDWYENGIPKHAQSQAAAPHQQVSKGMQGIKQFMEREGIVLGDFLGGSHGTD